MGNIPCGLPITNDCIAGSHPGFNQSIPNDIIAQDQRWKGMEGFFKAKVFFNAKDPVPYNSDSGEGFPFSQGSATAFYNHTFSGSRMVMIHYYFFDPAPEAFCEEEFDSPLQNHMEGGICGENGHVVVAGMYYTSRHWKDGAMVSFRAYGGYSDKGEREFSPYNGKFSIIDDYLMVQSGNAKVSSPGEIFSGTSFTWEDEDKAIISMPNAFSYDKSMSNYAFGEMERITEADFNEQVDKANDDFGVLEAEKIETPLREGNLFLSESYPSEAEWCGGLVDDPSCTTTPFQEPPGRVNPGAIAGFIIAGLVVFGLLGYLLHWHRMKKQARRFKIKFIQHIATNIKLAPSSGALNPNQLKAEFDRIDKDKGGFIEKEELRAFVNEGKLGEMSESDFDAMWTAIDVNNSGEVDFIEFCTFLSGCGAEIEEVYNEQRKMSRAARSKSVSNRLATRVSIVVKNDEGAPFIDEA